MRMLCCGSVQNIAEGNDHASKTLISVIGGGMLFHLAMQPALAQDNAAEKAVEAAKQYSGITLNSAEEAGLMAMLGINITGPEWEELTGISAERDRDPVRGAVSRSRCSSTRPAAAPTTC